jgi:hypothetical protein
VVHVSGAVEQEALFEYISENEERKLTAPRSEGRGFYAH